MTTHGLRIHGVGFAPRQVPVLLVESEHPSGNGQFLTKIIANLKVNVMFVATQVIDGKCGATIGFETDADAERAVGLIRQMTADGQQNGISLEVKRSDVRL